MLTLATEVDRKVALCLLIPIILSALIVVFASFGAATQEFGYAVWVRKATCLPAITELYKAGYRWAWVLPLGLAVWAAFLVRKPSCSLGVLTLFAGTECVLLTLWVAFSALAFYLGNQSFFAGPQ